MNQPKHVFRLDVPALHHLGIGDVSVRVVVIDYLIRRHGLDAVIVPPRRVDTHPLWRAVFKDEQLVFDASRLPDSHRTARISAPTALDVLHGSKGWNPFECALWENGFFDIEGLRIDPPVIFPCGSRSRAVMIYPHYNKAESGMYGTDGWISACAKIRAGGFGLNLVGDREDPALKTLFENVEFDYTCAPCVEGLRRCVESSCMAIGTNSGPTWTLLMSDIPQIVLESDWIDRGARQMEKCRDILAKRLKIVPTLEGMLGRR